MNDALIELPDLWRASWEEGVGPYLWHVVQQRQYIPRRMRAYFRPRLRRHGLIYLQQRRAADGIAAAFAGAGLPFVFLRGFSLASLYRPPSLRPQHDIDVLLPPSALPKAKTCLARLGFAAAPFYPALHVRGEVLVDLHTEPLGAERIRTWRDLTPLAGNDFLAVSGLGGSGPWTGAEFALVLPYLCFHALKHSFSRLIWLLDIALLARHISGNASWDEVAAAIRQYRLERPCFYALAYADAYLDAAVPASLLAAIRPRMGAGERRLFGRFMAHETVPFLAERVFARMLPMVRRPAFWWETFVPHRDVRAQLAAMQGGGWVGFVRQRLGLMTHLLRR